MLGQGILYIEVNAFSTCGIFVIPIYVLGNNVAK